MPSAFAGGRIWRGDWRVGCRHTQGNRRFRGGWRFAAAWRDGKRELFRRHPGRGIAGGAGRLLRVDVVVRSGVRRRILKGERRTRLRCRGERKPGQGQRLELEGLLAFLQGSEVKDLFVVVGHGMQSIAVVLGSHRSGWGGLRQRWGCQVRKKYPVLIRGGAPSRHGMLKSRRGVEENGGVGQGSVEARALKARSVEGEGNSFDG